MNYKSHLIKSATGFMRAQRLSQALLGTVPGPNSQELLRRRTINHMLKGWGGQAGADMRTLIEHGERNPSTWMKYRSDRSLVNNLANMRRSFENKPQTLLENGEGFASWEPNVNPYPKPSQPKNVLHQIDKVVRDNYLRAAGWLK